MNHKNMRDVLSRLTDEQIIEGTSELVTTYLREIEHELGLPEHKIFVKKFKVQSDELERTGDTEASITIKRGNTVLVFTFRGFFFPTYFNYSVKVMQFENDVLVFDDTSRGKMDESGEPRCHVVCSALFMVRGIIETSLCVCFHPIEKEAILDVLKAVILETPVEEIERTYHCRVSWALKVLAEEIL